MPSKMNKRWDIVFILSSLITLAPGFYSITQAAPNSSRPVAAGVRRARPTISSVARSAPGRTAGTCGQCEAEKAPQARKSSKKAARSTGKISCHPKGYVDPKVSRKYNAAMRDMNRAGIKPYVTSAWRSSQDQARLHNCSRSSKCRRAHPGLYYALPPGQSMHEAGFAVDISGVAAGPRGNKRLTPRGRRIVSIMKKNGFNWRYGLADPAHFEADPRKYGYRSAKQAMIKNQTQCTVRTLAKSKLRKPGTQTSARTSVKAHAQKRTASVAGQAKQRSNRG